MSCFCAFNHTLRFPLSLKVGPSPLDFIYPVKAMMDDSAGCTFSIPPVGLRPIKPLKNFRTNGLSPSTHTRTSSGIDRINAFTPSSLLTLPSSGNNNTSQPGQTGGLFSGLGNSTQQQQTGGLFGTAGGSTNITSQPQPTGGLFGGLGGASNNATSQPQQTGGLFGGLGSTSSQPQQSGGLFGSIGGNTQSQPQQSGGLFGTSTQNQTQNQTGGGLFGGLGQSQQSKPAVPSILLVSRVLL